MPQIRVRPGENSHGEETHPAFGTCRIGRITSTPGATLFQSDIPHGQYIQITLTEAARKRELKHDWVHPGRVIAQFNLSMAQFASMITSVGTEGVPVTLSYVNDTPVPGLYPDSRLKLTTVEVTRSADEAYEAIKSALAAYEQGLANKVPAAERKRLLSNLHSVTANAAPNVTYAADRLTEHAEDVVEKSRADIEAMVRAARDRGETIVLDGENDALELAPGVPEPGTPEADAYMVAQGFVPDGDGQYRKL